MNLRVLPASLVLALVCGLFAGCDRAPKNKKGDDDSSGISADVKQTSPFKAANEMFKYPNNPRSNDDWTRFRDGVQLLSEHFDNPEVLARLRMTAQEREFLVKEVHLSPSELAEVESTAFRSADAHYMDECYLLRDAAHHLEVVRHPPIAPLEQASIDFAWVMRNVLLHESSDTWMPPAFTLRHGYGNAVERSLLFLALLRQSQVEGCLIVVPNTEPLQCLVAAFDAPSNSLRLFDPRLERPVPGKDGKGIATLQEALETPALLQPSLITAEQTKKLEAWMVCPLYALAPRMLEMQKGLRAQDSITLYMAPENVRNQLAKATTLPIKIWNPLDDAAPTAQGPALPPNSPTRCLRLFLPKSDGGLDETHRLARFNRARLPDPLVQSNYAQIRLTPQLLPLPAFQFLIAISNDLLAKYDLQTRELYLRGKYEPMMRRQDRIQSFANNEGLDSLLQNAAFQKERAAWQEKLKEDFANLPPENANANLRAKMLQSIMAQMSRDQFVGYLLEVDKEDGLADKDEKDAKVDRRDRKTVLTKILAVGLHDYLSAELIRSRASTFHEIAADRQASLDAIAKPSQGFQKRVNDSWFNAKGAWGNSYVERIAIEQMIEQRLSQIRSRVHPADLDNRISLLEILHLDVQKYFQARMRLADALVHTDGKKAAHAALAKTKAEIEQIEKTGLLKAEIKTIGAALGEPGRAFFQKRLDLLAHDWSELGSYFWLQRQLGLRLAAPI